VGGQSKGVGSSLFLSVRVLLCVVGTRAQTVCVSACVVGSGCRRDRGVCAGLWRSGERTRVARVLLSCSSRWLPSTSPLSPRKRGARSQPQPGLSVTHSDRVPLSYLAKQESKANQPRAEERTQKPTFIIMADAPALEALEAAIKAAQEAVAYQGDTVRSLKASAKDGKADKVRSTRQYSQTALLLFASSLLSPCRHSLSAAHPSDPIPLIILLPPYRPTSRLRSPSSRSSSSSWTRSKRCEREREGKRRRPASTAATAAMAQRTRCTLPIVPSLLLSPSNGASLTQNTNHSTTHTQNNNHN